MRAMTEDKIFAEGTTLTMQLNNGKYQLSMQRGFQPATPFRNVKDQTNFLKNWDKAKTYTHWGELTRFFADHAKKCNCK